MSDELQPVWDVVFGFEGLMLLAALIAMLSG
jgi:hypothetical protein